MKSIRITLLLLAGLATSATVSADEGARKFVENEHVKLEAILRKPASSARDNEVTRTLDGMVDYDELARRTFGQPCPHTVHNCTNHWGELTDQQRSEVTSLLKKLVEKNYKKNLIKTLDYEVTYKGQKDIGSDAKVRTEAKSKLKPRDPAVQVDYVVMPVSSGYRVVDIITENSSLTKNYYDQFHKMLTTPGQMYPHVVKRLNEKISQKN